MSAAEEGRRRGGNSCLAEMGRPSKEAGEGERAAGRRKAGGPKLRKGGKEKDFSFFFIFRVFQKYFQMDLNSFFQIWSKPIITK